MAVTIDADLHPFGYLCKVTLSGLTVGTRYDVLRRQYRYQGEDSSGDPTYHLSGGLNGRKGAWSSVAHRVGWEAQHTSGTFKDFEIPFGPFAYFVVETTLKSPYDWDYDDGPYPMSKGVLDDEIIHLNRAITEPRKPKLLFRSLHHPGHFIDLCVQDITEMKYVARGTELPVMGSQYPVYVSDTREARRGTVTVVTETLGDLADLRRLVFPENGRIKEIIIDAFGEQLLLLDNLTCVPLDVSIEQATHGNADLRFVSIDFIETDPTKPSQLRLGDNDDLVDSPEAHFTISDHTPAIGQWVTLTDTSTGEIDQWHWAVEKGTNNKYARFYGPGPHEVRWFGRGEKTIKLHVTPPPGVPGKSADVIQDRTVQVHG